MDEQRAPESDIAPIEDAPTEAAPRRKWRWRVAAGAIALGLLVIIASVTALAIYQGLQDRAANVRREADAHYRAGLEHLQAGEIGFAIAEFELALRLAPDHKDAREKLAEAESTYTAVSTPTSVVFSTLLDGLFQNAVKMYEEQQWDDAASGFSYILTLSSDYRTKEIEQYLFDCYRLKGEGLEQEDRLEEAIRAYDEALRVDPSAREVARRRELLALYVAGASAAGADWEKSILAFSQLYALDPDYRDAEYRLYEAYVGYGDAQMGWGLWCQAEEAYTLAQKVDDNPTVRGKLNDSNQRCRGLALATQSPKPPDATAEPPVFTELPFGYLFLAQYDDGRKTYDLVRLSADSGTREVLVRNGAQPALSPDGRWLAYRSTDKTLPGIYVLDLQTGSRMAVTKTARDSRPFWSPDGQRLAFIRDATSPTAQVLTVLPQALGQPETLADGWSGAWSTTNHLALTRCEVGREECGIFVKDLGSGGQIRITGDRNDVGLAWSPTGSHIAYLSSHDGNWEVYTVRLEGGVVRRCTVNFADDGVPTWSPDEQYIAFTSNRDGSWSLYIMRADGSEQRKVLDLSISNPDWLHEQMVWAR